MTEAPSRAARIPLERELEDRLGFFIRLRWAAAAVILVGAALAPCWLCGPAPEPLLLIGLAVLVGNGLFALEHHYLRERRRTHYRGQILGQMAVDWVALTALVHVTGGISSPAALGFAFHAIIGAMLLSGRVAALQSAAAIALLGGLTAVEVAAAPEDTVQPLLYRWLVLAVFLGVVSGLTRSLVRRLRAKEQALVDSEQRLESSLQGMQALYELGQLAHATLELDEVLPLIAESATRLTGKKGCSIGLLDDTGQAVLPGADYGLSEDYLAKGPLQVARSAMIAQALAGEVVEIDDLGMDERLQYPERARREGIRSLVCVGLCLRQRPIGVLRVYSASDRCMGEHEISFLRNLANLAAVAIDNARTYLDAQEVAEERAWFARTTHHQLRAPLAVMRGLLEALPYAGELSAKQAELVARATRRVDELLNLVGDLLDLAYAQRPRLHPEPEAVRLDTALAPALETVRDRAEQKDIGLQVEDLAGAVVAAEAEDVRLIFGNLLDNAVKYTPQGGTVRLRCAVEGEQVRLQVSDTGIGIGPADRERVFRGFYRTEASRATGEHGTGVGLSIVQRLLHRWHGAVELDSELGRGSTFTVLLPAAGPDTTGAADA